MKISQETLIIISNLCVARALLRAASRLSRRFSLPGHKCPHECGHGTLRACATDAQDIWRAKVKLAEG